MFELFEKVRIKSNGAIGDIVDIDDKGKITVEGDRGETEEGAIYGGDFPLYYVEASDLIKIESQPKKRLDKSLKKAVAMF